VVRRSFLAGDPWTAEKAPRVALRVDSPMACCVDRTMMAWQQCHSRFTARGRRPCTSSGRPQWVFCSPLNCQPPTRRPRDHAVVPRSDAPLLFYLIQSLVLMAHRSPPLIGWRIHRRFGTRGLVVFLVLFPIYGAIHDYGGTTAVASSGMMSTTIVFAPGPVALVADALCYETMAIVALLVLRLIAGPATSDLLAPSSAEQLT